MLRENCNEYLRNKLSRRNEDVAKRMKTFMDVWFVQAPKRYVVIRLVFTGFRIKAIYFEDLKMIYQALIYINDSMR